MSMSVTNTTFALLGMLALVLVVCVGMQVCVTAMRRNADAQNMRLSILSRCLAATLLLGVVMAGWRPVAPTKLGGDASYAMVSGISMLPSIKSQDLVITHRQQRYAVGDV